MSPASSPVSARTLFVLASVHALVACGPSQGDDDVDVDVDGGTADATPDASAPLLTTLVPDAIAERMGFGAAMALSGDTLVVGATNAPARIGAAYVFVRRAERWEQQAKLTGASNALGFAMDVAIDGDTIAVSEQLPGATYADGPTFQVRVFARSGGAWSESAVLNPSRPITAFGSGMAIQGGEMVIGGIGTVLVYERDGETWTERTSIVPPGVTPSPFYGHAIALDGDRMVIGDSDAVGPTGKITGQVHVFERRGGAWQYQQVIAPVFEGIWPHDVNFGASVALRGTRVVIGMHEFCPTAKVYELGASAWTEVATLDPEHDVCVSYAFPAVAMAGDRVAIGATGNEGQDGFSDIEGAGYLFEKRGGSWSAAPVERVRPMGSVTAGTSILVTDRELLVGAPRVGSVFVLALAPR